jgi:hypothetical protein
MTRPTNSWSLRPLNPLRNLSPFLNTRHQPSKEQDVLLIIHEKNFLPKCACPPILDFVTFEPKVSRFSIGVEKWRWFVETPCDGGIARSMFQIMVRSSGGSLGKGEKATGKHCGVVVIVEMGDSNDGRADDRDDESKASVIPMSEQGRS